MIKKKFIGIDQYMPMDVIHQCILDMLHSGELNLDELSQRMSIYNKGENRAKKAAIKIASVVTSKNSLNKALIKTFSPEDYARLNTWEKNVIAVCLISVRYPFLYDTLNSFAKLFNLQDTVNRQYIQSTIAALYGSNLTLNHGLEAAIRILIDSGLIIRIKPGLYSKGQVPQICNFVKEAWIYTDFEISGRKKVTTDDLTYQPWHCYLPDIDIDWNNTKILKTRSDLCNQIWIESVK